jgi:hypothetical protein
VALRVVIYTADEQNHQQKNKRTWSTRYRVKIAVGGRSLKTRKSEHVRIVKQSKKGSNVAKHEWSQDHLIDFANAQVIDKGNHRNLKTLESWHTALTDEADNNSNTLPAQYTILLRKELKKH